MPINEIDIEELPSGQIGITLEVDQGLPGPANTLAIGSVTSGATPSATIIGSAPSQVLNLVLPKGDTGSQGSQGLKGYTGDAGQDALWNYTGNYSGGTAYAVGDLAVFNGQLFYRKNSNGGNVGDTPFDGSQFWDLLAAKGEQGEAGLQGEQGPAGSDALWNFRGEFNTFSNSNFSIGDVVSSFGSLYYATQNWVYADNNNNVPWPYDGWFWQLIAAKGADGAVGEKGDTGDAATITLGTVSTGVAGSSVQVTNSGTSSAAVFDFTIPRGNQGTQGIKGDTGPEPSLNIADNSATSITLADADNNKIIRCTAATAVTITVPSTLAAGFSCMVIQAGTGQVTFAQGSGATLNSYGNLLKTAGQHAPASLMRVGAGIYNLSGNLV